MAGPSSSAAAVAGSKKRSKSAQQLEEERFSKSANVMYFDGTRYLVYVVGALFTIAVGYMILFSPVQYESVDLNDQEKLRLVLSSGEPWVIFCRTPKDELPVGFVENLGQLGISKAAVVSCDKPLPQSGLTILKKYRLDATQTPVGFLTVGNTHTQLDSKLFLKNDRSLAQTVRKMVAKHFALKEIASSSLLRSTCSKQRCVVWASSSTFFGAATAAKHPKWIHVKIDESIKVNGKHPETAALVWPTKAGDRLLINLDANSKFTNDVEKALQRFEEDPSFAETKASKLAFEWATGQKISASSSSSRTTTGGSSSHQRAAEAAARRREQREKAYREKSQDDVRGQQQQQGRAAEDENQVTGDDPISHGEADFGGNDDGIDLDEL